ncbi:MAG: MFS transporter [Clostridia bacterium]|nr:MFS transporter [Clostridia bacterium]
MQKWQKRLVLFLASQTITMMGSLVVAYAVMWYITIKTSSGMMMMISVLCNCIPQILISPLAGVWADRYNRKLLVICSDLFVACVTLLLAILWLKGHTSYTLMFVIMALRSFGAGIQQPAVSAILPQIVPVENLTRVNAIFTTITSLLTLLAPALGGILLAAGFVNALFFDVGTAAIGVTVLAFLPLAKIEKTADSFSSIWGELKGGLVYVWRNDCLRFMMIFYAIGFFLVAPASYLTPILVERVYGPEIWRLTANEISWSLGAIFGGVIIAAWGGFKNRIFSMGFSFMFFGITFTALGLMSHFWIYLAIMLLSGLFLPMFTTAETTLIQEKTDPQMMGRVFSIVNIIITAVMPIAMLVLGPLADVIDVRYIIVISGVMMAATSLYVMLNKKLLALDDTGRPDLRKDRSLTKILGETD